MKLLTIAQDGQYRLGVKTEQGIMDVERALAMVPGAGVSADPMEIIRMGAEGVKALEAYIGGLKSEEMETNLMNEDDVDWGSCVPQPNKIVCVGLNYRKHADESKLPYPEVPILFNKFNNALTAHGKGIHIPKTTEQLDYEVELCIVIGKETRDVSVDEALDYVFGFCCANDISARDWQMRTTQWMLGKTCDGFCPIGPYLVTADEVGDPQNLKMRTFVNGELRQNSNSADMIFNCAEIISYISRHMTLVPGDLILTGTPEGVAMGLPLERRDYLKSGDEVSVEIEKLGRLTSHFM